MYRQVVFCLLSTLVSLTVRPQYPSVGAYTVSDLSTITFSYSGTQNTTEVPPWIVPGGSRSYFFADGSGTYIWSTSQSLVDATSINLNSADGPHVASETYIGSTIYNSQNNIYNWKRNYHGIYSVASFTHPTQGLVSLGFLHGENKNFVAGNIYDPLAGWYQNTIQPNVTINPNDPLSYSGGDPYHEGWEAYNGIISAAWIADNQQTDWGQQFFTNELGPIAWPATGYVTPQGVKCTNGLRHPSSIVVNDSVYVFYIEEGPYNSNIPNEEGRHKGVKVIKAALAGALNENSYTAYYRTTGGKDTWSPSLPAGFTKETMLNYTAVKGPKSTDILDDTLGMASEIRFSVAQVRNSNYFIGVEQYIDGSDGQKFKVALRFSRDLVHWTDRQAIIYTASDWDHSQLNYPIFLSKDGWSNNVVDTSDFYILGTGSSVSNYVNRIHMQQPQANANAFTVTFDLNDAQEHPVDCYPNPTTGSFKLNYSLNGSANIKINLYDMKGRTLKSLYRDAEQAGNYSENIDISTFASGIYLVELITGGKRTTVYKLIKD